jgi:DNA-binding transcriptional ArsR family regulator
LEHQLKLSQPSVSKHLRVLKDAGFVHSRVDAQKRVYSLRPEPLMELDAWLIPFRRFWSKHVDALERHLDSMAETEPKTKRRKKK